MARRPTLALGFLFPAVLTACSQGHVSNTPPPASEPETAAGRDHEFDQGSGIAVTDLSPVQIQDLALLGKVWGFLKYHHPRVTAGDLHFDHELFRVLPAVLAAKGREQAQEVLAKWVASLGDPAPCSPCARDVGDAPTKPRLEWLTDTGLLGSDLGARLRRIHANRGADAQHYVAFEPEVGNPVFDNESAYASLQPDAGFRLLAVYRLWNIIEYWFPYRDVMDEDWDRVLAEFIPKAFSAGTKDDYERAMIGLIARVHDGHANLWGFLGARPPGGTGRLPLRVRFLGERAVVTDYTDRERGPATGLEVADVILALDGTPVETLVESWRPWFAASNDAAQRREMARVLTKGPIGPVQISVERNGKTLEFHAERSESTQAEKTTPAHDHPGEAFRRLSDDLAYLTLSSVKAADAEHYVREAQGARCLVIDIRNYPSEFVVFALGAHLVTEPTEFARFTRGDPQNPGAFRWTDPLVLSPLQPRFEGRIAILVDEASQSQAEYTAMAFRAVPSSLVVGSTTAGADGNVSPIPLPGGVQGLMSGIGVFYPDKRPTQRVGIVPDVEVRPTLAGFRAGRDEVLEAAVRAVLGREITADELHRLGS